jgi:signal transduction histidine kinase
MEQQRLWNYSPYLVLALGLLLALGAVVHHANEVTVVEDTVGPFTALLLDGTPALVLAYAGYRLSGSSLLPQDRWTVVSWSFGGAAVFVTVIGATFLVRVFEGRTVAEPLFPLLIAVEAGGLAGLVAGYYNVRSRMDARRARRVNDALEFVNDLIRHDLRNDLNVVSGHAELLAEGDEPAAGSPGAISKKTEEALTRIEASGAVTDTLLGNADFEPVDLAALVADVAAKVESTQRVEVSTALPEQACVRANAGLHSVVDNLVENAVKHNDSDDPHVDVAVDVSEETVTLTVSDDGPGIPDDEKATLFDADDSERGNHGLSLISRLVEGYGGSISVEDNEPRGTTFRVELPRAQRTA